MVLVLIWGFKDTFASLSKLFSKALVTVCPEDVKTRHICTAMPDSLYETRVLIHFGTSQPPVLIEQLIHSKSFSIWHPRMLPSSFQCNHLLTWFESPEYLLFCTSHPLVYVCASWCKIQNVQSSLDEALVILSDESSTLFCYVCFCQLQSWLHKHIPKLGTVSSKSIGMARPVLMCLVYTVYNESSELQLFFLGWYLHLYTLNNKERRIFCIRWPKF